MNHIWKPIEYEEVCHLYADKMGRSGSWCAETVVPENYFQCQTCGMITFENNGNKKVFSMLNGTGKSHNVPVVLSCEEFMIKEIIE